MVILRGSTWATAWASWNSSAGEALVAMCSITVITPRSMKPGFAACDRMRAWMPRSVRCWLAERSKSPPTRPLRMREKAIAL